MTQTWPPGTAPVAVVLIALNEGHNMAAVLENLRGWAAEVFLVDSYSKDATVDIALSHGVHVVQRAFRGFGDQWNFALAQLPITQPWTMKLDPDERLPDALKRQIIARLAAADCDGLAMPRRLWFMGAPMPVHQTVLRIWRTGGCRFSDVAVNEYPLVAGHVATLSANLEHHDSPDLDHWFDKQNRYTTAEALMRFQADPLSVAPRLFGSSLQRRMWAKQHFYRLPFRYALLFLFHWLGQGAWRAGWRGFVWARLRADCMRWIDYKRREMLLTGHAPAQRPAGPGEADPRVAQY